MTANPCKVPYAPEKCGPTLSGGRHDVYAKFSADAAAAGRKRSLPTRALTPVRHDFSHNDYLGFARHPQIIAAARRAALRYGTGATGSRLLSGDSLMTHALERRVARMKHTPHALVFSSGYVLNVSVAGALLDRHVLGAEPQVFCDRYVHASLYHAFAHAQVRPQRYRHQDLDHLERLLRASMQSERPRFVFTESVFGMDGDRADLEALRALARTYRATLYVDEAHATGLFGPDGSGLAHGVVTEGGIVMGTFSKALGGSGAYVACDDVVRQYLLQRCGGFIYSTALPPPNIAAALTAWRLLPQCDDIRDATLARAAHVRAVMQGMGLHIGATTTHIIPAICSSIREAEHLQRHLMQQGIKVSLVRPPTVPPNAARVRIAISASHDDAAIADLLAALQSA